MRTRGIEYTISTSSVRPARRQRSPLTRANANFYSVTSELPVYKRMFCERFFVLAVRSIYTPYEFAQRLNRTTIAFRARGTVKGHGVGRNGRGQERFVGESFVFRACFRSRVGRGIPECTGKYFVTDDRPFYSRILYGSCSARSSAGQKTRSAILPETVGTFNAFWNFNLGFQRTDWQTITDDIGMIAR